MHAAIGTNRHVPEDVEWLRDIEARQFQVGLYHFAQIASATAMRAGDSIEPISMLVTRSGEKVVDTTGIGNHLEDRSAIVGMEALARNRTELVDPDARVHRRQVLVHVLRAERPKISALAAARITHTYVLTSLDEPSPAHRCGNCVRIDTLEAEHLFAVEINFE